MITGAQEGASDGNPGAFNSDPTLAGDRTDEFDPNLIPTFSEPVGGTGP